MKAKKFAAVLLAATLLIGALAGCDQAPVSVGNGTSTITVDRGEYLALKTGVTTQDISSVIDFIENLESVVGDIGDYTTSYDKDTNTVYATTDTGNIAFYLDANGDVVFASANGSLETKTKLNQGITRVSIGNYVANQVSGVLNQVEQTKWLNTINANVIAAEIGGTNFTQLDISLMYFETPALDNLMASDLERDVYGIGQVTMPVLTDTLASYGIQDLTNYYESPTLTKFWTGIDMSDMEASITQIVEDGISMGMNYANATLESPNLEVPEWSLSSYTLPSTFSDGTPTGNLGAQTLSAYESFSASLNNWKSSLLEQEEQAQLDGWANLQAANQSGLDSVTSAINSNQSSILEQAAANQSTINSMTSSAINSVTDKTNAASNATSDKTSSALGSITNNNSAASGATQSKTDSAIANANAQTSAAQGQVASESTANNNAVQNEYTNNQNTTQTNEDNKRAEDTKELNDYKNEDVAAVDDIMSSITTVMNKLQNMKAETDGIIKDKQEANVAENVMGGIQNAITGKDIPNASDVGKDGTSITQDASNIMNEIGKLNQTND